MSFPYHCRWGENVGEHIKITAVWDDATMFGGAADANLNKGAYGNTGYFLGTFPGAMPSLAHYSLANGAQITITNTLAPSFIKEQDGDRSTTISMAPTNNYSDTSQTWTVVLNTEQGENGETVNLNVRADISWDSTWEFYQFNFSLMNAGQHSLDSLLFGFNWDSSKGAQANGEYLFDYSRIVPVTSIMGISWSRAVLSRDAADLLPVPVPASLWMMISAITSLVAG